MIAFLLFLSCLLICHLFPNWYLIIPLLFIIIVLKKKNKTRYLLVPFIFTFLLTISMNVSSPSSFQGYGVVQESKENYYLLRTWKTTYYVYEKNNKKEIGDFLYLEGSIQKMNFTIIESQFDFQDYLEHKGVFYQLNIDKEQYKIKSILKTRTILRYLKTACDEKTFQLTKLLLFGESSEGLLSTLMDNLHFYYFFTISAFFFRFLFNKLESKKGKHRFFKHLLVILPFMILRPIRLFFIKTILDELIVFIYQKKNKELSSLKKISLSGLILLLINPFFGYQDSFLLIYCLSLFIIVLNQLMFRFKIRKKKVITFVILQLFFMLLEGYKNYEINIMSPFFQLLIPLMTPFILAYSYLFYLRAFNYLAIVANLYYKFLNLLDNISLKITVGYISFFYLIVFVFLVLVFFFNHGRGQKNKKVVAISTLLIVISIVPYRFVHDYVSFINVGQGDAILIENQGMTLLVDTGGNTKFDIAEESLLPFFKKRRISYIDYFIASHNDFDHIGGLSTLLENNYIKKVVTDDDFPLKLKTCQVTDLNIYKNKFSDENNKSRVLSFNLLNKSFLLMGDAGIEVEDLLLKSSKLISHDIIKIGHHGSKTSSSYSFLKMVHPQEAIISCGQNNVYHHPHQEVLERLKKLSIIIRRTDMEGTITYQDKKQISLFKMVQFVWYTYYERRHEDDLCFIRCSRLNS